MSIFHFSVLLTSGKNAKMEYTCAQFLLFYVFVFNQKRKKQKNEIYFVEFSIFPFLDQNRKIGKLNWPNRARTRIPYNFWQKCYELVSGD